MKLVTENKVILALFNWAPYHEAVLGNGGIVPLIL
jgi:hypothetical protein